MTSETKQLIIKIITIAFSGLASLAILFGLYQWRFGTETSQIELDNLYQGVSDGSLEDYYQLSQQRTPQPDSEVNFYAVGDIMLSRNVAGQISKNNKDSNWPFKNIEKELLSTDFNFGNLESPYSGRDDFNPSGSLVFNAPTWTLPGLTNYNFKILNLANNHGLDQGLEGLRYTKKILHENNVLSLGVGDNLGEAWQGQVYTIKDVRIGFIGASYASINDGGITKNNNIARIEDLDTLKIAIANLKTKSDFVVVTMHAGTEYTRSPNQSQTDFARAAIDNGADIVIGAHPHWIQTFEQYKGKYIFYSLGNFVFDQMWSQDTKEGLMLKITLNKSGGNSLQGSNTPANIKQIQLEPVVIENYGQPRIANEVETQKILNKIGATTAVVTP